MKFDKLFNGAEYMVISNVYKVPDGVNCDVFVYGKNVPGGLMKMVISGGDDTKSHIKFLELITRYVVSIRRGIEGDDITNYILSAYVGAGELISVEGYDIETCADTALDRIDYVARK